MSYGIDTHFIKKGTAVWSECDTVCFYSKNLYNQANYRIRQHWFQNKKYLNYNAIQKQLQTEQAECYTQLPAKVSQQVLRTLDSNWKSFFAALRSFKKNPNKFKGPPKSPNYKDKNGRNAVTLDLGVISKIYLKDNKLKFFRLNMIIKLRLVEEIDEDGVCTYKPRKNLRDVTIIPRNDGYEIVVKYLKEKERPRICGEYSAGIDIGLNNLATIITNNKQADSFIVNGKPLKALNAYYNKRTAEIQSKIDTTKSNREKKRLQNERKKLARKRHFRIKHYLHETSKMIVTQLVSLGVQTLVIGKNTGWKQEINIGTKNNQNFVYLPHAKFVDMLKYKWEQAGGVVILQEESYTSKCSFLDSETIKKHETYLGRRVKRGLFESSQGLKLNADVNGAGNILRKGISNAFSLWEKDELIKGFCSYPRRIATRRH
jgi:putative transposase